MKEKNTNSKKLTPVMKQYWDTKKSYPDSIMLFRMGDFYETFDEDAKILQGVLVEVEEAYGHCPRAFSFSSLWDTDQINQNRGAPAKLND